MVSVDIVLPVYNEAKTLEASIEKLVYFLQNQFGYDWRLIIAENSSFDKTLELAKKIKCRYAEKLSVISSEGKGRDSAFKDNYISVL
jgi:glycosyltransferase involved in cell wall biosynthesis